MLLMKCSRMHLDSTRFGQAPNTPWCRFRQTAEHNLRAHQHYCNSTGTAAAHMARVVEDVDWSVYRKNVGICVVNRKGLVFAAQRLDDASGSWQMPQGGIDPGECHTEAALRELREETSITSVEIVDKHPGWLTYEFPPEVIQKMKLRNKGQAQRWFLMRFNGDDDEINLETESREFSAWAWMPLERLPSLVIPFKRDVYEGVALRFSPVIRRLQRPSRY